MDNQKVEAHDEHLESDLGQPNALNAPVEPESKEVEASGQYHPVTDQMSIDSLMLDAHGFDDTFEHAFVDVREAVDQKQRHRLEALYLHGTQVGVNLNEVDEEEIGHADCQ